MFVLRLPWLGSFHSFVCIAALFEAMEVSACPLSLRSALKTIQESQHGFPFSLDNQIPSHVLLGRLYSFSLKNQMDMA